MREKTCCFTGHRKIPPEKQAEITGKVCETVLELYHKGIRYFGTGGALGFDMLASKVVLSLREKCPGIKLILVLPCLNQTKGWQPEDIAEYEQIKAQADKVVYTSQEYTKGCMFKRNRHLVDHSSVCICYLIQDKGGTAYTVNYAAKCGVKTINIAV